VVPYREARRTTVQLLEELLVPVLTIVYITPKSARVPKTLN
jgi:hypothetical protein